MGTPLVRAKLRVPKPSGLHRDRLIRLLASVRDGRTATVIGPAGSGKTTLLSQFAASVEVPVAWYQAEASDGDPHRLLSHLHESLSAAVDGVEEDWESVDAAVAALDTLHDGCVLLIDDFQALERTASEAAVERLTWFAPPKVAIVVASRRQPGLNLSRLRVADRLVEIDSDALRFRSWEVERLFREVYAEPMPPEDLATLACRTEGWAAGLQLFHLATRGKSANERREMVRNLSSRTRLVREYLAQNVIEDLPSQLRQFLLDTCVLGRLSGPLCDEFLGRSGTATLLEEIERRHIFLSSLDDGMTYRYHEVLRSHLESLLIDGVGDRRVRERYRQAGQLLEATGACSEALLAYCRAGDESAALRLLSRAGAEVADDPGSWLDLLPAGVVDHDPWLILAAARRHLSAGRWRQALTCYQRLDSSSPGSVAHTYQLERRTLTMWLEPVMPASADWIGILCQATRRDPLAARQAAARLAGPTGQVAAGMAALLAGQVADARLLWQRAAEDVDSSPVISAAARLAAGIAELLSGAPSPSSDLHLGREGAERLGLSWLARLASCAEQCLSLGAPTESDPAMAACLEAEDLWGAALIGLFQGFGWLRQPDRARVRFLESARLFRQLGAAVLEAWARAGAAVAATKANDPDANELAAQAESVARTTATWGALRTVCDLFRLGDPKRASEAVSQAKQLGADGIAQLNSPSRIVLGGDRAMPGVTLTCLGDFNLILRGTKVDLGEVKPRVRSLIRLLALHTGRAVHRETLIEALWPGGRGSAGTRNLQVAVSAARQLLERTEPGTAMILREGDAYRLALPERADVDLISFDRALERASRARARGDGQAMRAALARCLDLYNGDVLAVEGPAEWVLEIRDRYRLLAVEAAEALAEVNFGANDFAGAARACERGLNIDRYQDRLWRIRVEALERAGDLAAASLARRSYNEVLADLGLTSVDPGQLGAAS